MWSIHTFIFTSGLFNGQWFATDPTGTDPFLSNGKTYPVDQKTTAGLITEADWARINPMEAELDRKLSAKEISYEEYEKQMCEILKSMW